MTEKPSYQYITELLDFAELLAGRITADNFDSDNYFMTLVYIEDVLDKYGRTLALQSANEHNLDGNALMNDVTRRMDDLRGTVARLNQEHAFDEVLSSRTAELVRNWVK